MTAEQAWRFPRSATSVPCLRPFRHRTGCPESGAPGSGVPRTAGEDGRRSSYPPREAPDSVQRRWQRLCAGCNLMAQSDKSGLGSMPPRRHLGDALLESIFHRAAALGIETASGRDLPVLVWALAWDLASAVTLHLTELQPQGLAMLLWGFAVFEAIPRQELSIPRSLYKAVLSQVETEDESEITKAEDVKKDDGGFSVPSKKKKKGKGKGKGSTAPRKVRCEPGTQAFADELMMDISRSIDAALRPLKAHLAAKIRGFIGPQDPLAGQTIPVSYRSTTLAQGMDDRCGETRRFNDATTRHANETTRDICQDVELHCYEHSCGAVYLQGHVEERANGDASGKGRKFAAPTFWLAPKGAEARELSNIVWSVATVQVPAPEWLTAPLPSRAAEFLPQESANLLWALAVSSLPATLEDFVIALQAAGRCTPEEFAAWKPQDALEYSTGLNKKPAVVADQEHSLAPP
eukprot:s6172_g1.t1